MFDTTPSGILEVIANGESETVEFKTKLPPDKIIARVLIGFANFIGGILLIGVGDKGEIVGLSEAEIGRNLDKLHNVCSSIFSWSVEIGVAEIQGKDIVYAVIDKAPEHLAPVMTSTGEIYIRRGEETTKLSNEDELRLLRKNVPEPQPVAKNCVVFVAMSFRDEEEPALVDYYHAMKRAVERTKLPIELVRIDLVEGDYEISQQLMNEIDNSDIVIADFTLSPANVYFELGYARGIRKRIIQTARKSTALEFDVRNWRTTFYRNANELEEKLVAELQTAYAEVTGQA